jgi:hypothetical protein
MEMDWLDICRNKLINCYYKKEDLIDMWKKISKKKYKALKNNNKYSDEFNKDKFYSFINNINKGN